MRFETARTIPHLAIAIALSVIGPAVIAAADLSIEVDYTKMNDCPDVVSVDLDPAETDWDGFLGLNPKVKWVEHEDIAKDQAEWTITWTPQKNAYGKQEYSHLPPSIKIPKGEDKSEGHRGIAANAPNSEPKWYWTYEVSVKKGNCAEKTLDPTIIFRDGSGGSTLLNTVLTALLLLAIGGSGFYFGKKFADD